MRARLGRADAAQDGIAADSSKAIANPSPIEMRPKREDRDNKMVAPLDLQTGRASAPPSSRLYMFSVGLLILARSRLS